MYACSGADVHAFMEVSGLFVLCPAYAPAHHHLLSDRPRSCVRVRYRDRMTAEDGVRATCDSLEELLASR